VEQSSGLCALELVRLTAQVIEELPVGYAFLVDQLKRASSSIPLNFGEWA
jgi:hypothetical protein